MHSSRDGRADARLRAVRAGPYFHARFTSDGEVASASLSYGIRILANGGFEYKCFHASCEFNKATGWQPPRRVIGPRERHLYELLGGNPEDLTVQHRMGGYSCVDEMIADRERARSRRAR